jgi:hypothetical protein
MSRHSGAPYGPPSAGEISVPNPITANLHPALYRVALALAAVAAPAAAQAQTTFIETPITVNGHQNVRASWINRHDAVVATVFDHANEPVAGAVLQGTTATYIKPPYTGSGPAQPQQIDDSGNVLGFAQYIPLNIPQMFLLRAGVADPNYDIALIEPFGTQGLTQPNPIGIGGGRVIFYTRIISLSAPTDPSYGIPPNPLHYTPEYSQFQTILSVNAHGIVAGRSYGLNGQGEVFFGRGSDFTQIAPAGALSSSGGYINAAGAVAGSYVDSCRRPAWLRLRQRRLHQLRHADPCALNQGHRLFGHRPRRRQLRELQYRRPARLPLQRRRNLSIRQRARLRQHPGGAEQRQQNGRRAAGWRRRLALRGGHLQRRRLLKIFL